MPAATRTVDPMIAELEQEAVATRRMLERVPGDKLDWAPHPKSMTLGQLAYHVAGVCGDVSNFLETDEFDAQQARFMPDQPSRTPRSWRSSPRPRLAPGSGSRA
jgi:hypothetical protein